MAAVALTLLAAPTQDTHTHARTHAHIHARTHVQLNCFFQFFWEFSSNVCNSEKSIFCVSKCCNCLMATLQHFRLWWMFLGTEHVSCHYQLYNWTASCSFKLFCIVWYYSWSCSLDSSSKYSLTSGWRCQSINTFHHVFKNNVWSTA